MMTDKGYYQSNQNIAVYRIKKSWAFHWNLVLIDQLAEKEAKAAWVRQ
jgi:hypothetical protein